MVHSFRSTEAAGAFPHMLPALSCGLGTHGRLYGRVMDSRTSLRPRYQWPGSSVSATSSGTSCLVALVCGNAGRVAGTSIVAANESSSRMAPPQALVRPYTPWVHSACPCTHWCQALQCPGLCPEPPNPHVPSDAQCATPTRAVGSASCHGSRVVGSGEELGVALRVRKGKTGPRPFNGE